MSCAIQVRRLKKSYGDHTVLREISFDVLKGEMFALLGVNGAGKTTALECIEGLRRYDGGSITVNGSIGIQLQSASLPAYIRPMEAVRLFAKWNHTEPNAPILTALGIDAFAKKRYHELSTGQKRRLHLALALTGDPDILFLDEPTAGLDVEGRVSLHNQLRKLKAQGKTIVLASHDMAEVENLCERIAILSSGGIVFSGTVTELSEQFGKRFTLHIETGLGNESHETDDIANTLLALLQDFRERGIAVLGISIDRGTLEEYFIDIARGKES